jgi:hypothetical protein
LLLNADGSSLKNSSQAKFIDVFGLIVPIADGACAYSSLTSLLGLPYSEEVELLHHGKHDDRSVGFREPKQQAVTPELSDLGSHASDHLPLVSWRREVATLDQRDDHEYNDARHQFG